MRMRLRRQIKLLQAYAIGSFVILIAIVLFAMGRFNGPQSFSEVTVQRLNVVDANGTLRLVISNKDRMHPGVVDGIIANRTRTEAGLLFFNDVGDEVGGLLFTGQERNGQGSAGASFTLDQWKQDQIIAIQYNENDGQRSVGLHVWDRPETSLGALIEDFNAATAIEDPAARGAALRAIRSRVQAGGPQRLFVGKDRDRASTIMLADAAGNPRLNLKVQADGTTSIEFLDAEGRVTDRLPN